MNSTGGGITSISFCGPSETTSKGHKLGPQPGGNLDPRQFGSNGMVTSTENERRYLSSVLKKSSKTPGSK